MKFYKYIIIFCLILANFSISLSRPVILKDSISYIYEDNKLSTIQGIKKANYLNYLSEACVYNSNQKSIFYSLQAIDLSKSINYMQGYSLALLNYGNAISRMGYYDSALTIINKSLNFSKLNKDIQGEAKAYIYLSNLKIEEFDFKSAFDYGLMAIKIYEAKNDYKGLIDVYEIMVRIYRTIKEYPSAIEYNEKIGELSKIINSDSDYAYYLLIKAHLSLLTDNDKRNSFNKFLFAIDKLKKTGDKFSLIIAYRHLGDIKYELSEIDSGFYYHKLSLFYAQSIGDRQNAGDLYTKFSNYYNTKGDFEKALEYNLMALEERKKLGLKSYIASSLNNIANSYFHLHQFDKALSVLDSSLSILKNIRNLLVIKNCYYIFHKVFNSKKDFYNSLEYYKLYSIYNDSLLQEENRRQIMNILSKYEDEKKENEINKERYNKQKYITILVGIILTLVIILALLSYNRYKTKKKDNLLLQKQKQELENALEALRLSQEELKILNDELELRVEERTEELHQASSNLKLLTDNMTDILLKTDNAGYIKYVSPSFTTILGYDYNDIMNKTVYHFVHYEDFNKIFSDFLPMLRQRYQGSLILRVWHKNGYYLWIEIRGTPLRNEDKEVIGGVFVCSDITKRKEADMQLSELNKELEEANYQISVSLEKEKELNLMKTRFIQMISHEYRTPLTIILSSTEFIKRYSETGDKEQIIKYAERIETGVNVLTHLIDNVLTFQSTDVGNFQINKTITNLTKLCSNTIEEIKLLDKENHIFEFNYAKAELILSLDVRITRQILTHILINAIKFSPGETQVKLNLIEREDSVLIELIDQGVGMTQEELQTIFNSFQRRDKDIGLIPGIGLGLAIVRRYIEALSWNINFQSEVNRGTKVIIVIPK